MYSLKFISVIQIEIKKRENTSVVVWNCRGVESARRPLLLKKLEKPNSLEVFFSWNSSPVFSNFIPTSSLTEASVVVVGLMHKKSCFTQSEGKLLRDVAGRQCWTVLSSAVSTTCTVLVQLIKRPGMLYCFRVLPSLIICVYLLSIGGS